LEDFAKLKKELEDIKKSAAPEMDLGPLEKWMKKKLGVERLADRGGVTVI